MTVNDEIMNNIKLETLKPFVAGFNLAARRLPDGKLRSFQFSGNQTTIDDWPDAIELYGITYTLEKVIYGNEGYESGVYV